MSTLTINLALICLIMSLVDAPTYVHTVLTRLLNNTPAKEHNTFDLSVKYKFCGPYSIMAVQSYLLMRTTSL